MSKNIKQAIKVLNEGGIILYPTEGVYGLGCDPFNETAVQRLLKIKKRDVSKGLILIAADWEQVKKLIKIDPKRFLSREDGSVPTTWILPITKHAPSWITGKFKSIAIRVTKHPVAKNLCQQFGGPIVSTSANITKEKPITKISQVNKKIINNIDCILSGKVGTLGKPTQIRDAKSGKVLRG